jgi:hypothetical protein
MDGLSETRDWGSLVLEENSWASILWRQHSQSEVFSWHLLKWREQRCLSCVFLTLHPLPFAQHWWSPSWISWTETRAMQPEQVSPLASGSTDRYSRFSAHCQHWFNAQTEVEGLRKTGQSSPVGARLAARQSLAKRQKCDEITEVWRLVHRVHSWKIVLYQSALQWLRGSQPCWSDL